MIVDQNQNPCTVVSTVNADPKAPVEHPMSAEATTGRISSLDQFRGYTVVGMLLVNFLGGFDAVPDVLKHHNTYCSYADTIMPQFFFAVGFAYRLTFLRRLKTSGFGSAAAAVVRRCLGLILLGFVVYHLDGGAKSWAQLQALGLPGFVATAFQRNLFQTLVHIALTSIWVLPVIAAGQAARVGFLIASSALHLWLSSRFYFEWVWGRPGIDGGPLGFLSWTIPLLAGSLAYDAIAKGREARAVRDRVAHSEGKRGLAPGLDAPDSFGKSWGAGCLSPFSVRDAIAKGREAKVTQLAAWGLVLMLIGYGISCLGGSVSAPPFVPPGRSVTFWTMSQRTGSISYLAFATGFSLLVYAFFVATCDLGGVEVGVFRVFGRNALAAYILHGLVAGAIKPYVPHDAPLWYVSAGFGVYVWINYLFIASMDRAGLHLRL
jgi:predicted acyltransferase